MYKDKLAKSKAKFYVMKEALLEERSQKDLISEKLSKLDGQYKEKVI